ncbi:hypothetical protein B566_EDAN002988 [Ephemera danica]|nr:hypothetical protein B566_EDAN002988 [Ephemera danica]
MAKSLRSKWKKQMRAAKRVRYGLKELEKLKAIVATHTLPQPENQTGSDDISDIATVVDARTVCDAKRDAMTTENAGDETMDVDKAKPKYNRRTMKDENGKYPVWLSKRRIRQISLATKKAKAKARVKGNTNKKAKTGGKRRHR